MESGMWTTRTTYSVGVALSTMMLTYLLASAVSVRAQGGDVTSVLTGFHAALNAGDVDGSLAFFADDAVANIQGDMHQGKDAIRAWLTNDISVNKIRVEVLNLQVAGNKATWTARLKVSAVPEPFQLSVNAIVENGKIVSFTALPMPTQPGTVIPATGEVSLATTFWLLVLASLGLLGLGLMLRRQAVERW